MRSPADFLARLVDPARPRLDDAVTAVVAHPDDETLGFGGQIDRFTDLRVVVATDGAPRDPSDARAAGFAAGAAYAEARRRELLRAIDLAGLARDRLVALGMTDQEVVHALPALVRTLRPLLQGRDVVLTHAFEGGHPDHDALAVAVRRACAALPPGAAPAVVEMPYYRAGPDGARVHQCFLGSRPGIVVALPPAARERKRAMLAAHVSQRRVLAGFATEVERFRAAAPVDPAVLPDELLWERMGWLDRATWLRAIAEPDPSCA